MDPEEKRHREILAELRALRASSEETAGVAQWLKEASLRGVVYGVLALVVGAGISFLVSSLG